MTCVSCGAVVPGPARRGQPPVCARCALAVSEAVACCARCSTWRSCRWLAGHGWLCVARRRSCFTAALRENGARRLLGAIKEGD